MRFCELCREEAATVFCPSDAAFLCRGCDGRVHGANFLVARHVRRSLVSTRHDPVSSLTCTDDDDGDSIGDSLSSSNSSACNSSTTTIGVVNKDRKGGAAAATSCNNPTAVNDDTEKKNQREAVVDRGNVMKGLFLDWCGRLGLGGGDLTVVVRTACAALRACKVHRTHLPLRVGLAAAVWLGLRLGCRSSSLTWNLEKRLEGISGVPARVILAVGSKLERAARIGRRLRRDRCDLVEGWDESS